MPRQLKPRSAEFATRLANISRIHIDCMEITEILARSMEACRAEEAEMDRDYPGWRLCQQRIIPIDVGRAGRSRRIRVREIAHA